ncbi:MAG TPA: FecR domain-containing protein [Rhodothermales bacterium]|nr:FecR domain-containing protein [Rhodothermales bacterium]
MKDPTLPDLQHLDEDYPDVSREKLARVWQLAEGADPFQAVPPPHPDRIDAIQATLERAALADRPALRLIRTRRMRPWMAVAASIVVLALVGLGWWLQPVSHTAPVGETLAATLPDGSEVQLNSNSTIRYPRSFGQNVRTISLEGEAFFDVQRSEIPFVIETFNSNVKVLGTSFNVQAWRGRQPSTVVTVVTGIVEVTPRRTPDAAIRLTAGQHTNVSDNVMGPTPPAEAHLDQATAWRTGQFIYYNQPLGVMFDEIEHRFNLTIEVPPSIRARRQNFIKHEVESAESLLSDLCQSVKLRYRPTANGYEVFE